MRKFLCAIFIFASSFVFSQRVDAGLWTSLNLEKTFLDKTIAIGGSFNYRMDQLFQNPNTFFPEVNAEVRFLKLFRIGVEYRFVMRKVDFGGYVPRHRFGMQLVIRKKMFPFIGSVRGKFQIGNDLRRKYAFFQPDRSIDFRFKVKLAFDKWKRIKPFISNEIFYDFTNHSQGKRFNLNRFAVGMKFDLPKRHEIKIAYLLDWEFNVVNPLREHIAQIGYYYSFKGHSKKKSTPVKK